MNVDVTVKVIFLTGVVFRILLSTRCIFLKGCGHGLKSDNDDIF